MPEKKSQSISSDRISESTIARIAGNLMSGFPFDEYSSDDTLRLVKQSVATARAIASEVRRTAAPPSPGDDA